MKLNIAAFAGGEELRRRTAARGVAVAVASSPSKPAPVPSQQTGEGAGAAITTFQPVLIIKFRFLLLLKFHFVGPGSAIVSRVYADDL